MMTALFWFVFAVVLACIEIESEGRWGWAEKAPTWYRTTGIAARLYGLLMGGKPLTGYHAFMFFMPVLLFHVQFFSGVAWTLDRELVAWAMYFSWCVLWDFLWFVLNPHYGIKEFRKSRIWWHAKSWWIFGRLPFDYILGWMISIVFAYAASCVTDDPRLYFSHLGTLGVFILGTMGTVMLAPWYHHWYLKMREYDDRDRAGITHRDGSEE